MKGHLRRIAVITGARGEYGYIKPVLRKIEKDPDLDYSLVITDMHLLPEFGYSAKEIEKDGFKISERIYSTLDGYTNTTMAKSLGIFLMQIGESFERLRPDIVLISGDRGVQLMAAIAGAHMYIPVAHIQAGEVSGNIDDSCRHAITKFSHVHFAATESYAERVRRLGEQEFRIKVVGAPLLDDLLNQEPPSMGTLEERLRIRIERPLFLVVQHPVTEQAHLSEKQMSETMEVDRAGRTIYNYISHL